VPALLANLREDYLSVIVKNQMGHAALTEIAHIKTDFVFQPSDLIEQPVNIENIRMASIKEISAMKISAIIARGKKRDFIDLFCLLNYFSLTEILEAFIKKYKDADISTIMRSLFYYEDAENDLDPKCLFTYNWENIKNRIRNEASKIK
jgi:predicted nucleotidyltransferase component of viral defense system